MGRTTSLTILIMSLCLLLCDCKDAANSSSKNTRNQSHEGAAEDALAGAEKGTNAEIKQPAPEPGPLKTTEVEVSMPGTVEIQAEPRGDSKTETQIAAASKDAVVSVITPSGNCSGFLINADGYIVTNAAFVNNENEIKVSFAGAPASQVRLVKIDLEAGIALLKIEGNGFSFLRFSASGIQSGEKVTMIGASSRSNEKISIVNGVVQGLLKQQGQKLIQSTLVIEPESAGAPILDTFGQVVGLATTRFLESNANTSSLFVPADVVLKKLNITMR